MLKMFISQDVAIRLPRKHIYIYIYIFFLVNPNIFISLLI